MALDRKSREGDAEGLDKSDLQGCSVNMDSGCRRPSGVTGLREAKAFGFDGAYPRAWRSRENAVRSAQAGLMQSPTRGN